MAAEPNTSFHTSECASANIREAWTNSASSMLAAMQPGIGFSFKYANEPMGPVLEEEWKQSTSTDAANDTSSIIFAHPSGLQITRQMRVFSTANAVEYKLIIENTSSADLPAISALDVLDVSLDGAVTQDTCVVSTCGGLFDCFLPPRSFAIRKQCFPPTAPDYGRVDLKSQGGRSSNGDLPLFFIHNEVQQEGMFVAFGWSGQWEVTIVRNAKAAAWEWGADLEPTLRVRGRIPDIAVELAPGERIDGPTVLVGLYRGTQAEGSNQLRRLIRDVYAPRLEGKQFLPIATYGHWWHVGLNFDETLLRKLADGAAALGQEYFLLDPGWNAGSGAGTWAFSPAMGNWLDVDKERLPSGLKPLSDYIRDKGMKFGMFFEPERVAPGSQLANEHADWVLWDKEKECESALNEGFNKGYGLLNYGRPEVQAWVIDMLSKYIRDYDVRYIRYDFNIDPLPYWNAKDTPNRRGMTQLRYIEGLYAVLDSIRERHPGTVLENIAAGGCRIDLETLKRFHVTWVGDQTVDPSIIRFHLFGINYFLPGNHYAQYTLPTTTQKNFQADDLGFQSLFGGEFGIGGRVDTWPESMRTKARTHIDAWKKLRRFLVEDYYPLTAQPGDLLSWSGWQFHDPKDGSGFVQTFRTRTVDERRRFVLHGLDNRANYRFTDAYSTQSFEMTGLEVTTKGIDVDQQPMSSRVFMYEAVNDAGPRHTDASILEDVD